jgi:hypothetical protein
VRSVRYEDVLLLRISQRIDNDPSLSAGTLRARPLRSLYVLEITLRLRKGFHRETSKVTVRLTTIAMWHLSYDA